jgi:hypothetical protein
LTIDQRPAQLTRRRLAVGSEKRHDTHDDLPGVDVPGLRLFTGRGLLGALLHPSSIPLRLAVLSEKLSSAPAQIALTRIARGASPIVVGPWIGEVGFELLYWIPFLHWAKAAHSLDERRLVVVSRGGTAAWYRGLSDSYLDLLDFYSLDEFRARNERRVAEQRGIQKHRTISKLDREIVERVKSTIGAKHIDLLHPTLMNQFFQSFWQQRAGMWQVERVTRYRPFEPIDADDMARGLPDDYVAVKFYFNNSFPDSQENRAFVARLLKNLSTRTHVVTLTTGLRLDDHLDCELGGSERIRTVEDLLAPRNNLEVQTKIVSRARAFFGTYGGFSYLAPLCGVDSLSFYSDRRMFNGRHLDLAQRVFTALGRGSFTSLDVGDLDLIDQAIGGAEAGASQPTWAFTRQG